MFDKQDISRWLMRGTTRQLDFDDALTPLFSLFLLRIEVGQPGFVLHQLVQLLMRTWLKTDNKHCRWVKKSIEATEHFQVEI